MPSADEDLALAFRLARVAAEVAFDHRGRNIAQGLKADGSPVSEADLAVEEAVLEILSAERPSDAVLTEERGAIGSADRRWILDPIDGTSWFVSGEPGWGTHVALEVQDEVVIALVTRPGRGRVWWARRGGGAFTEGLWTGGSRRPLRASTASDLSSAVLSGWLSPATIEAIGSAARWMEPGPNTLLEMLDGRPDAFAYVHRRHVWDHAPYVLLVEEAGGAFRAGDGGRPLCARGGIYGSRRLVETLAGLLNGP